MAYGAEIRAVTDHWSTEYYKMIEDCELHDSKLTDWETTFLDSIQNYLEKGKFLTQKQIEQLEKIHDRVAR